MNKLFGPGWELRMLGVGGLFTVLGETMTAHFDGKAETVADWGLVLAVAFANLGNLISRQNNVSSEKAGANPSAGV